MVVQLAVLRGARVIATASPASTTTCARSGPSPWPTATACSTACATPSHHRPITVAIDTVGTDEALDTSVAVVADRQRIATIAGFRRAGELGIRALGGGPGADPGTLVREAARAQLAELAADGALDVRVAQTYALEDAAKAHADGLAATPAASWSCCPEPRRGSTRVSRDGRRGSRELTRRVVVEVHQARHRVASSTSSGTGRGGRRGRRRARRRAGQGAAAWGASPSVHRRRVSRQDRTCCPIGGQPDGQPATSRATAGADRRRASGRRGDLRGERLQLVQDAADDEALRAVATQQRVDPAAGAHARPAGPAGCGRCRRTCSRGSREMPWPAPTSASTTWKSLTRCTIRGAVPDRPRPPSTTIEAIGKPSRTEIHDASARSAGVHRRPRRERVVERHRDVERLAQQRDHPHARPVGCVLGPVRDDDVDAVGQRGEVVLGDVLVGALERDAVDGRTRVSRPGRSSSAPLWNAETRTIPSGRSRKRHRPPERVPGPRRRPRRRPRAPRRPG